MDFLSLLNPRLTLESGIVLAVFLVLVFFGYFIMYKEIKVIKQEISPKERLFCLVFGIIFSASATLGVLIGVQYASQAPPIFGRQLFTPVYFPRFTTYMFLFLFVFLMVFPLVEFLALALRFKDETLFSYQKYLHKYLISRMDSKIARVVLGIGLYIGIFWVPPLIVMLVNPAVPVMVVAITLFQAFPIFQLSVLGTEGYIWGINLHYNNIFERDRLLYSVFDEPRRARKIFNANPIAVLAVPVMLFVYFNSYISLGNIIGLFSESYASQLVLMGKTSQELGFSFLFSTIINIVLALAGYYNKYWKKQVKYKLTEILLAGYLFASLSMNIFLNFYVKNPDVIFQDLKASFGATGAEVVNVLLNPDLLVPVAMIQKVVFVVFATYYLAFKSRFKEDIYRSIIVLSKNRLNPRPLFNFTRHHEPGLRQEALNALGEIYRLHSLKYIPPPELKKKRLDLSKLLPGGLLPRKRKQVPFSVVFDALGSDNAQVRRAAASLLGYMGRDDPEQAIALFNENIEGASPLKLVGMLGLLEHVDGSFLAGVDFSRLLPAIEASGVETKIVFLGSLPRLAGVLVGSDLLERLNGLLASWIDSPDMELQVACLGALDGIPLDLLPDKSVFKKVLARAGHVNMAVKQAAVLLFDKLQSDLFDGGNVEVLLGMLDEPNPRMQGAAAQSLVSLLEQVDVDIPGSKIEALLASPDEELRRHALALFSRLHARHPERYHPSMLTGVLERADAGFIARSLPDLDAVIDSHPAFMLPYLVRVMNESDIEHKEKAKHYLVKIGTRDFKLVLDKLLSIKEDSRFAIRNFSREILAEIGLAIPDEVIPFLVGVLAGDTGDKKDFGGLIPFLESREGLNEKVSDENFRMNAAAVIGDVAARHPTKIDIDFLVDLLERETSWRVKRELISSISKVLPLVDEPPIQAFIKNLDDENPKIRQAVLKGLVGVARQRPELVPVEPLGLRMGDEDESTREALIKLMGILCLERPAETMPFLLAGMNDEKWAVRNAAAEAIGNVARQAPDKVPGELLLDILIHDDDKWTRWQAARSLAEVLKKNPGKVSLDEIAGKIDPGDDENLAIAYLNILRQVEPEPMSLFLAEVGRMMNSELESIQEQVANTLYHVYGKTRSETLVSELMKRVDKEFPLNVQRTSAMALGKIAKYDPGPIKKRVKKVLGARCKQARDPVICREFTALD